MCSSNQGTERCQQKLGKISSLLNFEYSHPDAHDLPTFSSQLLKILCSGRPEAIYKEETFFMKISPLIWAPFTNTKSFNFLSVTAMSTNWNGTSLSGNWDLKYWHFCSVIRAQTDLICIFNPLCHLKSLCIWQWRTGDLFLRTTGDFLKWLALYSRNTDRIRKILLYNMAALTWLTWEKDLNCR